jgi:hypothetical protein
MAEPSEPAKSVTESGQPPEARPELPHVESPPFSLADEMKSELLRETTVLLESIEPTQAPSAAAPEIKANPDARSSGFAAPKLELPRIKLPRLSLPGFAIPSRVRRTASLAATVMIAAGLGAAFGAAVNRRAEPAPASVQRDTALIEENAAMQKSIARLTRELAALKTSVDAANKENVARIGKLADKIDRIPETTGSISRQAAAAPPPPAAAPQAAAPVMTEPPPIPPARPAIAQQDRRSIVAGWTVHEVRNGVIWVENRGELFGVQVGAPLPGLGTVEAVRREGNQWVVVTPKGIISSAGESTAANVRPRPYYPPYYRPY